jgi:hypothetical protein
MPTIKLIRLTVMSSAKLVSVCKENSLKISYINISKIVIQCMDAKIVLVLCNFLMLELCKNYEIFHGSHTVL